MRLAASRLKKAEYFRLEAKALWGVGVRGANLGCRVQGVTESRQRPRKEGRWPRNALRLGMQPRVG